MPDLNFLRYLKFVGKSIETMSMHEISTPKQPYEPEVAGFIAKTYEILCVYLIFYLRILTTVKSFFGPPLARNSLSKTSTSFKILSSLDTSDTPKLTPLLDSSICMGFISPARILPRVYLVTHPSKNKGMTCFR